MKMNPYQDEPYQGTAPGDLASRPVITYSLCAGQSCSQEFYRDVSLFADAVASAGEEFLGQEVDDFLKALRESAAGAPGRGEMPRTRAEYFLDLLVTGLLWRIYGSAARGISHPLRWYLTALSQLGEQHPRLKKVAYFGRGLFSTHLRPPGPARRTPPSLSSTADLERLERWMVAAGRLKQEARRVSVWRGFFNSRPTAEVTESLSAVMAFAAWFEEYSLHALGAYTPRVEHFLRETHPPYRWREDFLLCGRQRVEYHLNMVGTEILNRALREDFRKTRRKIVLVPPCMAALPDDRCRAKPTPFGNRCAGCTPGCRVNQLTRLGEERGFSVFTLPEDLRVFSANASDRVGGEPVGIVGVSCALTNLQGGWDVRDLGIPAQGLVLDYCGCTYHWSRQKVPTDINFDQLLELMGS